MHPDEHFLATLVRALDEAGLEAIVVGATAAVLQGAPTMTQDVDLLIRDTRKNREKLHRFSELVGGSNPTAISDLSPTLRILGLPVSVDILFDELSGGLKFASLRSRSIEVKLGDVVATVASLEDVIASKEATGRAKDLAQLPILRHTLEVRDALAGRKP